MDINRRDMLVLIGGSAATTLSGCVRGPGGPSGPYNQQTIAGCLVSPEATEGPFFVDEKLNRSDLRIDPVNGAVSPGVPLKLVLNVSQAANKCTPLVVLA